MTLQTLPTPSELTGGTALSTEFSFLLGHGQYRQISSACMLSADNDLDAIREWITRPGKSDHTRRAYKRECERLLSWCAITRKKKFSDLNTSDFMAYAAFLADPQPREVWCGPRQKKPRKPLEGPLSQKSIHQTMQILSALTAYLHSKGYLSANALAGEIHNFLPKGGRDEDKKLSTPSGVERFIDEVAWDYVVKGMNQALANNSLTEPEYERMRFVVSTFYLTGLRLHELATALMHDIELDRTVTSGPPLWRWTVHGKGDKVKPIELWGAAIDTLVRYRRHRGLSDYPAPLDPRPVVASLSGRRPVGDTTIYNTTIRAVRLGFQLAKADHHAAAHTLSKVSPHWFRHAALTRALRESGDLKLAQGLGRHSKISTTGMYVHNVSSGMRDALQNLTIDWSPSN